MTINEISHKTICSKYLYRTHFIKSITEIIGDYDDPYSSSR